MGIQHALLLALLVTCTDASSLRTTNTTECPPGQGFNTSTKECHACPIGYYSKTRDGTPCMPCKSGTYDSQTGSTNCTIVVEDCNTQATGATSEEEAREHCTASNLWGQKAILAMACVVFLVMACLGVCCCLLCY